MRRTKESQGVSCPWTPRGARPAKVPIAVFSAALIATASAAGTDAVYFQPIASPSVGLSLEDQMYLWQRARHGAALVPADLPATTTRVADYRQMPSHHALKETLLTLVDNEKAWPEYVYVARLNAGRDKYEYLVSSSDVIEGHPMQEFEVPEGLIRALELGGPVVTDITGPYPAVYIPFYKRGKPVGFFAFAKNSWGPDQRRVLAKPATLEEAAWTRLLSLQNRGQASGAVAAPAVRESTPMGNPPEPASVRTTPIPSALQEPGLVRLGYGEGRMGGKRSLGGSGHAIRFQRPAGSDVLRYVELFGSRYGDPHPPDEDFKVYVLDADLKVLHTLRFPYSKFERGDETWVALPVANLSVPETFWIAVDFNPHQTKGVYVGTERTGSECHSKIGTPETGFHDWNEGTDWMIRAYVGKPRTGSPSGGLPK